MYKDISIVVTLLIIAALMAPSLLSAKSSKRRAAEQKIFDAEHALMLEADAAVSDETLPEDEFYEKTKEIFDKLEALKEEKSKF